MAEPVPDKEELRDLRLSERGDAFKAFVASPFFRDEFVPLVERHFAMWLDAVMTQRKPVETLDVLRQLMADIDTRIDLGKKAAERIIRRRYGSLLDKGKA